MWLKRKRWILGAIWIACFAAGSFAWKILHTGSFSYDEQQDIESVDDLDLTVYVGDYLITREDIEWEYQFYFQQIQTLADEKHDEGEGSSSAEKAPDSALAAAVVGKQKPIIELYNKIMGNLIERKLLYQYIGLDSHFNLNEPSRFTACLQEWQSTIEGQSQFFKEEKARKQLKSMICEKDILQQYIRERINSSIQFSDSDLRTYYNEHKSEFFEPARVMIRQVLLASEADAKKVKSRITSQNFAEIAEELSIAPESKGGGLLGPFAKGDMPSLFDVAFEMNPGEIQGILKSTYGFHIIMLEKKSAKVQLSWVAAREQIMKILSRKREDEEYKKWVEMALNNIPIKSSRNL